MSTILVGVRVNASTNEAFNLFTDNPGSWWLPTDCFEFSSRGEGKLSFIGGLHGQFVEQYADGTNFVIGEILEWQPGQSLAFTWRQERFVDQAETHVQVLFSPIGDSTRVNVIHKGWANIEAEQAAKSVAAASIFLPALTQWWQDSMATYGAAAHNC